MGTNRNVVESRLVEADLSEKAEILFSSFKSFLFIFSQPPDF